MFACFVEKCELYIFFKKFLRISYTFKRTKYIMNTFTQYIIQTIKTQHAKKNGILTRLFVQQETRRSRSEDLRRQWGCWERADSLAPVV